MKIVLQIRTISAYITALTIVSIAAYAEHAPGANGDNIQPTEKIPKTREWSNEVLHEKLRLILESLKADQPPLKSIPLSLNNTKLQKELFQQFEKDYPALLADALKSAGNMHNPKVLPLRAKFSEIMLKTPTIQAIGKILHSHGYSIASIGCEKFSLIKENGIPEFFSIVYVNLEPPSQPKVDRNSAADPPAQVTHGHRALFRFVSAGSIGYRHLPEL